jgi:hypothetical protein
MYGSGRRRGERKCKGGEILLVSGSGGKEERIRLVAYQENEATWLLTFSMYGE